MRWPRIKVSDRPAVYHCISRTVGRDHLLQDLEKEELRKSIRLLADFCGVEIITYSVMSTHDHILVRTPGPVEISDEELARRVRARYGKNSNRIKIIENDLKNTGRISPALRNQYLVRMGDISMFMKDLNQHMTCFYNKRHERIGTIWAGRFKSPLIENVPSTVLKLAAYIDANAIQGGLEQDPKGYRYCGYAEALAGGGKAQAGLATCLPGESITEKMEYYRQYLFSICAHVADPNKRSLKAEEVRAVMDQGGVLPIHVLLCLKIRYFIDGGVLGSKAFVEEIASRVEKQLKRKRPLKSCPMIGADWGGLMVLRNLQKNVFG
jgi:putative transposase